MLPTDAKARKALPICTGVLDYFPLALAEVARISKAGNDQHNPGQPLHWAFEKSTDEPDALSRHLLERGGFDELDGQRHSGKLAWRALALLERELRAEAEGRCPRCLRKPLPGTPCTGSRLHPERATRAEPLDFLPAHPFADLPTP